MDYLDGQAAKSESKPQHPPLPHQPIITKTLRGGFLAACVVFFFGEVFVHARTRVHVSDSHSYPCVRDKRHSYPHMLKPARIYVCTCGFVCTGVRARCKVRNENVCTRARSCVCKRKRGGWWGGANEVGGGGGGDV